MAGKENVIFVEGNHERHVCKFVRGEESSSGVFEEKTKPEILAEGISPSDLALVTGKLQEIVQFSFNDKRYIITHAGLSRDLSSFELGLLSTKELVGKGVNYEADIDGQFS